MQYGWRTGFSLLISGSTNKLRIYLIAHNYVVCKMSSTKWPQFRIFLIFQDRELQELRHIINNLKEKNEMGDQSKVGSEQSTVDSRYSGFLAANFHLNSRFFSNYQNWVYEVKIIANSGKPRYSGLFRAPLYRESTVSNVYFLVLA